MWNFTSSICGVVNGLGKISAPAAADLRTSQALSPVIFSESSEASDVLEQFKEEEEEGPVMVADAADIVRKFVEWEREMPIVEPFYAVKSNPDLTVLNILAALGTGFDCASKAEMEAVLELGVPASRIVYTHTYKPLSHLLYAAEAGVHFFTFDSKTELHKMKKHHPQAQLVLRIRADERGSRMSFGAKFGCEKGEVAELLRLAKELQLLVVGVSFHVGINRDNPAVFATTIEWCKGVFEIARESGHPMTLLDLGGGFPGARADATLFMEISRIVRGALEEHFPVESGVRIIAEPGKYFVKSAFRLYTRIIGKREKGDHKMYFLNDGVYGSFRLLQTYQVPYKHTPLVDSSDRRSIFPSSLWGPTQDGSDCLEALCPLPDMRVDEWIAFEEVGAYTLATSTTFNGFQKPRVKCLLSSRLRSRFESCSTWSDLCDMLKEQTTAI